MSSFEEVTERLRTRPRAWLVTGVAGFIGSNLLRTLLELDQSVVGLDNFATGHRANLDEVRDIVGPGRWSRLRFLEGDVASPDVCREALDGVDVVLHQAALGSVPRSIEEPLASNDANVTGTLALLEAARRAGVRRFVFASSSSVYGDSPTLPKVEDPTGSAPLSPYATTKLANELYAGVSRASPRAGDSRAALLQRVRPAPGSRGGLRGGDPVLDRRDDPRRRGPDQRHRRDEPRLLLREERGSGEPARRHRRGLRGARSGLQRGRAAGAPPSTSSSSCCASASSPATPTSRG